MSHEFFNSLTSLTPLFIDTEEIDEVKFWPLESIKEQMGKGIFSSHFEQEFRRYIQHSEKQE